MKYIILLFIMILIFYCFCNNSIEKFTEVDDNNSTIIKLGNKLKELQTDNGNLTDSLLATGVITSNFTNPVPIGSITPFFSSTLSSGWLLCDGSPIDTKYAELISIVGNNTPDLRGRLIVGSQGKGNYLKDRPLLQPGGEDTHILTINDIPSHNHSINDSGNHQHTYTSPVDTETVSNNGHFFANIEGNTTSNAIGDGTDAAGNHTHTIEFTGNDEAHENMMPSLALNYIIRAI
jgi:microcystin-dependent protein